MVNESMLLCYCCTDNFDSECSVSAKALVISDPLIELDREDGFRCTLHVHSVHVGLLASFR